MEIDPIHQKNEPFFSAKEEKKGIKNIKDPLRDLGASSIEKSTQTPPSPSLAIIPLLSPSSQEMFAVVSTTSTGEREWCIITTPPLIEDSVKDLILEGWEANLREIEEEVQKLLNSPFYQQLQEIKNDPAHKNEAIDRIENISNPASSASLGVLSTLDRLHHLEKVTPSAPTENSEASADATQMVVIPFAIGLTIAGGFALATTEVTTPIHGISSNPLSKVVEMVEGLQPLFVKLSIQDMIPVINLMVIGPIYYHSWNEAISNFKNHERHNYTKVIQKFAQDIIKMVTDPTFIVTTTFNQMKSLQYSPPAEQERIMRMFKVILCGVALGLLYSIQVGKVQQGKFGGMESEELRDLLLGKMPPSISSEQPLTIHEELIQSTIQRTHEQLSLLSREDRVEIVHILLDYLGKTQELDPMLDPIKVFSETIAASHFKPNSPLIKV
jgi:hypothetical protein